MPEQAQAGGCPGWCVSDHEPGAHPDDDYHVGAQHTVPVILRRKYVDENGLVNYVPEAAELEVFWQQHVGDRDTWLFVGEVDRVGQGLEITVESAGRLRSLLPERSYEGGARW